LPASRYSGYARLYLLCNKCGGCSEGLALLPSDGGLIFKNINNLGTNKLGHVSRRGPRPKIVLAKASSNLMGLIPSSSPNFLLGHFLYFAGLLCPLVCECVKALTNLHEIWYVRHGARSHFSTCFIIPFHQSVCLFVCLFYRCSAKSSVVRFEVFTAQTMKNGVFWDVTPCGSC
jgi:hypothetical protein